ncbi:hypothetical protein Bsp3421_006627 [Burkholderia sp. FERM BP-3421]|jgi:hypothetical protein|nr:hypothetical protein [Burkholderia sp. FERM BP-3421]WDD96416.1 hypothetical protein Bsp3421_006627 [Burkholderia sp. FERM BP-3421]
MTDIMTWAARRNPWPRSTLVIQAKRAMRGWEPIACAFLADRALAH